MRARWQGESWSARWRRLYSTQDQENMLHKRCKPATRQVAILAFHKIGGPSRGPGTWNYVPEKVFVRQLAYLQENGWRVIDLEMFLDGLSSAGRLPQRSVLLTFDDGYKSIRSGALPFLIRFGYPAVVFVPTQFIGRMNSFDAEVEPEEPMCTRDDLLELERNGVSVQSHGVTHRHFSELDPTAQEEEVRRSKRELEIVMGKVVKVFAYPYGDDGGNAGRMNTILNGADYRAAFLYGGGPASLPAADAYHLSRVPMGPDTMLDAELSGLGIESGLAEL
jgi:peptidoglycan/xylan/chitin deacetylase (PgdA/CDA1 family)